MWIHKSSLGHNEFQFRLRSSRDMEADESNLPFGSRERW